MLQNASTTLGYGVIFEFGPSFFIGAEVFTTLICTTLFETHFRGIYDVKATDMGVNQIRFKSEIDFDGAEVTRSYLDRIDIEALLKVKLVFFYFVLFLQS